MIAETTTLPRIQAETLRREGISTKDIAKRLGVPRGTVYGWVKHIPLTPDQRRRLLARPNSYRPPKKDRGSQSALSKLCQRELTNDSKAQVAEAAVMLRLTLMGLEVFGAVFDCNKADWMVRVPSGRMVSVQVKCVNSSGAHGLPTIRLTCADGHHKVRRYRPGEFDFVVGYDLYTDTAYIFSEEDVASKKTAVSVAPEYAERWDKLLNS